MVKMPRKIRRLVDINLVWLGFGREFVFKK